MKERMNRVYYFLAAKTRSYRSQLQPTLSVFIPTKSPSPSPVLAPVAHDDSRPIPHPTRDSEKVQSEDKQDECQSKLTASKDERQAVTKEGTMKGRLCVKTKREVKEKERRGAEKGGGEEGEGSEKENECESENGSGFEMSDVDDNADDDEEEEEREPNHNDHHSLDACPTETHILLRAEKDDWNVSECEVEVNKKDQQDEEGMAKQNKHSQKCHNNPRRTTSVT